MDFLTTILSTASGRRCLKKLYEPEKTKHPKKNTLNTVTPFGTQNVKMQVKNVMSVPCIIKQIKDNKRRLICLYTL